MIDEGQRSSNGPVASRAAFHLLGGPTWTEHRLGHALAQRSMVIDASETKIGERQVADAGHGVVGRYPTVAHVAEQLREGGDVHVTILHVRDQTCRISRIR